MSEDSLKKNETQNSFQEGGLFDKILCVIAKEKETRSSSRLMALFITLFCISAAAMPFSFAYFFTQWNNSGVAYFIRTALLNMDMFFRFWQDFLLSIIESFPIAAVVLFAANLALLLFTVRLFLHKKGVFLSYIKNKLIYGGK
jgi:hypothetical protein